ncbi:MAG: hypothetical protein WCW27_04805 [Patescibacteria group bacterium]|jgi:predicted transcriptional regulator of viral defense system
MYRITRRTDYVAILLKETRQIFHTQDLMVLWGIYNKNTLYTTIKRYVQKKILYSIQKGLYSTVPINQLDDWELGSRLIHDYSYISCETILHNEGYISPYMYKTALVSNQAKQFEINEKYFYSRKLSKKFLYNPAGISRDKNVYVASPERAIADLLYFNPSAYFDRPINWPKVKNIQQAVGYQLTPEIYD